ncbi:hypothetical protein [Phyllobacterium brassicacearum]|uniref:hypothetical protein n=1 Tax=Phyllobacterium brassicacearum TaxID=314235 RepID=UPI00141505DA|nr:hypothetical protein [Phyllobacterium brassicacearum]
MTSDQVESGILSIPGPQHSPWDVGFLLNVGRDAQGELIIRDGGVAFLTRVDPIVVRMVTEAGGDVGGIGNMLVTGAGSSLDYGHEMRIGGVGTGSVVIENGARVFDAGPDFNGNAPATAIGVGPGGSGSVRVAGTGSIWEAGARLSVGTQGAGSLDVVEGGRVSSDTAVIIGRLPGGNGTVLVYGANSVLDPGSFLFVGLGGAGLPAQGIAAGVGTGNVIVSGEGSALATGSVLNIGNSGTGTLTVGTGATVTSPAVTIASEPGSSGTLNVLGGALQTGTIVFGAGSGKFNLDPATDYNLTAQLSGAGTFNVLSGKVIQTADSSGFTGNTNVAGGNLIVNGTLGGVIVVHEGGLLGGTGTVGSTSINDGGLLAPGSSIGALHVNGDLAFNEGSIYRVEVDLAGTNDQTLVSGVAMLSGGHVDVIASAGSWRVGTVYTILTAAGGLNGSEFLGVSSNLQFLDPTLTYDPTNVMLMLRRNDIDFSDLAKTPNQRRAAKSIDDFVAQDPLPDDNPLIGKLLGLDKATAPLTIAQLPGEIHVLSRVCC